MSYSISDLPTNRYNTFIQNGKKSTPGSNGYTGFRQWECYMLLKYGKPNQFGVANDNEYLIELPIYPNQVQESINSDWSQQNILGRSSPLAAYSNTGLKSVSFELDLHRDLMTGSYSLTKNELDQIGGSQRNQSAGNQMQSPDGPFETRTWYVSMNKMLQMSCYPQYTNNGLVPPTTYFVFGQMILKGYVTSYSTSWKKPILNTFYGWNTVSINMQCYPDFIISARDFIMNTRSNSKAIGTASTQNTYNTVFPTANAINSNVMTRSSTINRNNSRNRTDLGENPMDVR